MRLRCARRKLSQGGLRRRVQPSPQVAIGHLGGVPRSGHDSNWGRGKQKMSEGWTVLMIFHAKDTRIGWVQLGV